MELFTIIAQLINFSILIFLLNIFLYKPIFKMLEKRRADVKNKIDETEKKLSESEQLKNEYLIKLNVVEKENIALRKQAAEEIKLFKELELKKAKDELQLRQNKFNEYLGVEQKNLVENFNSNFTSLFIEYSNNILKTLANSNIEKEIVYSFIDKIDKIDKAKIDGINLFNVEEINILSNPIMTSEQEKILNDFLIKKGFKFKRIKFIEEKKLIIGLELKVGSYVVSWSVKELTNDFISQIENRVNSKN